MKLVTILVTDPLFSLIPVATLVGIGMLWVFRHTADQQALRRTKKRLQAHLLELRLFANEPAVVWNAQKDLLRANADFMRLMLRPAALMMVPMILLLAQLQGLYGLRPLSVGQAAIVTMQMRRPIRPESAPPILQAPAGMVVETPPVRVLSDSQITWRVRPQAEVSGLLRVALPGELLEKYIEAGRGLSRLSRRRTRLAPSLLWHSAEWPLRSDAVEWIEVRYPPAKVRFLGTQADWLVWFLSVSLVSAWLLKNRFGVVL